MKKEPREYTPQECREMFMSSLSGLVDAGIEDVEVHKKSTKDALISTVFGVLTILEGATRLPALSVKTRPCQEDREFLKSQGRNWWPEGVDILRGEDHHQFINKIRGITD